MALEAASVTVEVPSRFSPTVERAQPAIRREMMEAELAERPLSTSGGVLLEVYSCDAGSSCEPSFFTSDDSRFRAVSDIGGCQYQCEILVAPAPTYAYKAASRYYNGRTSLHEYIRSNVRTVGR